MEKEEKICEGQAVCRPDRSCVDHVYTAGKKTQGRNVAGLTTYCLFLDVQKANDTACENGVGKVAGNWDQRKGVGKDEKYNGMCEK